MITRTSAYSFDEGTPIHVVIAETYTEGLAMIGRDIQEQLGAHNTGRAEIYACPTHLSKADFALLDLPKEVNTLFVSADHTFSNDQLPRAAVTLNITKWSSPSAQTPDRHLNRYWELRVCPPGTNPAVHELAETLMWDAEDAGYCISHAEAFEMAEAVLTEPVVHLTP